MKDDVVVKVANFVWFQTIWWLVILFQNQAVLAVVGLLVLWLWFSRERQNDLKLMASMFIIGTLIDTALTVSGVFIFTEAQANIPLLPIPIWLSLLWAGFAGTVYHSLTVFEGRPFLAALGGAIFAPLSYIAGANFDAVELGFSIPITFVIIGIVWSIAFPFCFYLSSVFVSTDTQKEP